MSQVGVCQVGVSQVSVSQVGPWDVSLQAGGSRLRSLR